MNDSTVFIYENSIGRLVFASNASLWVTDIDGMSSVEIDIASSRSTMQIGGSLTSQSVRPRSFTMDGAIFEPIESNRKRVLDIIAPQVYSTLTVIQNDESWFLDVVPQKTPEITPGIGLQEFQVRLFAAYPYWRTTKYHNTLLAGLIALFRFPFFTGGRWWISKYSDDYFTTIENKGNVPIDFIVTFRAKAAIENPELYQMNTRKLIRVRKKMVAGERVIVSTIFGQKTVTCVDATGKASNGFRFLSSDSNLSMALEPGDNIMRADAADNREGMIVHIQAPEGVRAGV